MTGSSSPFPKPDPAVPGRNAPQANPPHAGAAHQSKQGNPDHPVHPEQRTKREAFDASAYRASSLPPNPAYEEFQREYAARYAPYSEPTASRRRKSFRAIHMALIFTLGAAVGLGGAWWADSSGRQAGASSPVPGIVSVKPALPPYEQLIGRENTQGLQGAQAIQGGSGSQGVRGIRPSELPYDGRPPEAPEDALASAPAAPLPSAAISSGSSDEEEGAPSVPPVGASIPAPAAETSRKYAVSPDTVSASRAKDADDKASAAAASSKRTTVAKNAKTQEIERIRRQADDELRKKNSTARRADDERNASRVAQRRGSGSQPASTLASTNNYKGLLAQCEAASNIFRREQCKWKLCNGMWGKNGCPSYAKPNSLYNY